MEVTKAWEVEGQRIEKPFGRTLKYLMGPDRGNVKEINFNFALIDPHSQTDYHKHDRPELIYVVKGEGESICDGETIQIKEDVVFWVRAGEMHQVKNTGDEVLKLATLFTPPYSQERMYGQCLERRELEIAGKKA